MGTYSYSGKPVFVTIGKTGVYDLDAFGGQGGTGSHNLRTVSQPGGKGAEAGGYFTLRAGEKLEIFVGGAGGNAYSYLGGGGGGGGGTFVFANTGPKYGYVPLLVAGGGGGGYGVPGGAASVGAPGSGLGGLPQYRSYAGGGGAGVNGAGGTGAEDDFTVGIGGSSRLPELKAGVGPGGYLGGFAGGAGGYAGNNPKYRAGSGGFGGGGGGAQPGNGGGGGGGGGYTGGDGGFAPLDFNGYHPQGLGGTSFDAGTVIARQTIGGENSGNGELIIASLACYARGTLIRTRHGEMPVEVLAAGDTVLTAAGERRAVRWIGRRSYAGRFLAANPGVQPIRFRAGSLGDGLPRRDLLVSPEHAMFLDGMLIPARCLTNGSTIVQERGLGRVDYFHVELDSHDVLLAEGAPSESYLDDNSRGMFHNAAEFAALYPDAGRPDGFCAPRIESGFQLEAIRRRLAAIVGKVAQAA